MNYIGDKQCWIPMPPTVQALDLFAAKGSTKQPHAGGQLLALCCWRLSVTELFRELDAVPSHPRVDYGDAIAW